VIAALLGGIAPVNTWAAGADLAKGKDAGAGGLQAAISRAATEATTDSALRLRAAPAASLPAGRPKSGARMQSKGGGGHTGMIIGLITTAVGIAATVYAVKAVEKETKTVQQPQ
jgi:hypothetical protein